MHTDIADIRYSPIRNYDYAQWFETIEYNGRTLNDREREVFISMIDDSIAQFTDGLPLINENIKVSKNLTDEFHHADYVVCSVMLFVLQTMIDIMVSCKFFIKADSDYERRFMRGKLMVILNEGFKRLYGFKTDKAKNKGKDKIPEWKKLEPFMIRFPEVIAQQYNELGLKLNTSTFTWWKEERDLETHLDAENLYISRQKELIESEVMIDSLKLFNTLFAVNLFLTNVHACLVNTLLNK